MYLYSLIFNFKQLSAYAQALKSTSTDVAELSKLTSLLTTKQTINALSSKGLTDQQVVQILMNKGIVKSEAEAIASKMASSTANGVVTFSFKAYTAAIWENIKALIAWMASNPVGWIIGIGVAIGGAVIAYNLFDESIEEQKEKLKDLEEELLLAYEKCYMYKYNSMVKYKGYNQMFSTVNHKLFKQAYQELIERGVIDTTN